MNPDLLRTDDGRHQRIIGLPTLMKMAVSDQDLTPVGAALLERAQQDPHDANALMDLSIVLQLRGERDVALAVQGEALQMQRLYRYGGNEVVGIRVLVLMGGGDLMANMPIEFLVEDSDVALFLLYILPGEKLPQELPQHDILVVALAESDQNHQLLLQLNSQLEGWPRPVINPPHRIIHLSRDGASALLQGLPGVLMPLTVRMNRHDLESLCRGEFPITRVLADGAFPVILRPVDSHAGHGLAKLDTPAAITGYLADASEDDFYISRFVDYSGPDKMFRKCRVALIQGRSYVGHMAVSARWMVHYLNADMLENASNRMEEERFMACFDDEFALRHAEAFQAITQRVGLEYLGIDCAETKDGELLIFEIDNSMVVHAMDPVEVFPYKQPAMCKLFGAFRQMLIDRMTGANQ